MMVSRECHFDDFRDHYQLSTWADVDPKGKSFVGEKVSNRGVVFEPIYIFNDNF